MMKKWLLLVLLVSLTELVYPFSASPRHRVSKTLKMTHRKVGGDRNLENRSRPTVTAVLRGQLGNNLFEVATATALALDNDAECYFSQFDQDSPLYKHVFFRCQIHAAQENVDFTWTEPSLAYKPIPYVPNTKLSGFFQSEKYFAHHRNYLLNLFAPRPDDLEYMQVKYEWLINSPDTVGVQLRYYKTEDRKSLTYPQYGKDYLKKAMSLFPSSSVFVVSSNNLKYARRCIPRWAKNVYFIENEPNYIDLYLLSFCKNNIITNSSFGWWGAWLNKNPKKIVVAPELLFYRLPYQDYCPEGWVRVAAVPDKS